MSTAVAPAYQFALGTSESVVASVQEWAGDTWADLRISYKNRQGVEYPTKRGLRVRPEHLGELEAAVRALRAQFAEAQ